MTRTKRQIQKNRRKHIARDLEGGRDKEMKKRREREADKKRQRQKNRARGGGKDKTKNRKIKTTRHSEENR